MIRSAAALAPALVVALAATAGGDSGSSRYPPEPLDADKEAELHSDFWERALQPDRGRYDQILVKARRLIDARTPTDLSAAADLLTTAIALLPDAPDGYYLRGWAHELALQWSECADDYGAAATQDPDYEPAPNPRTRGGLADGLGVCLARAGKFEDAEAVLAQATAAGSASAAVWMHLAEVDMALGRLDDAIAALDGALKAGRANDLAAIHWLRAVAYDRARRPSDAIDASEAALRADTTISWVLNRTLPSAPVEDYFYIAGVAYEARIPSELPDDADQRPAQPERALLYFREFVERAPTSPWKKRAEEHIAALRAVDPADALSRRGARQGTSTLATATIAKALRKDIAGLGRCLAKTPQVVAELRIVIHGPAAARPKRGQPVLISPRAPVAGAFARVAGQVGLTDAPPKADLDDALKCLETAGAKLRLPKLERGTYVQLTLPLVSR